MLADLIRMLVMIVVRVNHSYTQDNEIKGDILIKCHNYFFYTFGGLWCVLNDVLRII